MKPNVPASLHLRPYRPEDAPRIKQITEESFPAVSIEAAIDRQWPVLPVPWIERKWQAMQNELQGQPEGCFVAEIGGEVAGYVTTAMTPGLLVGRIPDLAVDARYRAQGVGRTLLEHALEYFRAKGLRIARIETLAHNTVGNHLYPQLGFVEVARQVHFAMPLDSPTQQPAQPPCHEVDPDAARA